MKMRAFATEDFRRGDILDVVRMEGFVDGDLVVRVRRACGESPLCPIGIATADVRCGEPVPFIRKSAVVGRPDCLKPYEPT